LINLFGSGHASKVDFGILFPLMDCFIVHGGLGTTVEALRTGEPWWSHPTKLYKTMPSPGWATMISGEGIAGWFSIGVSRILSLDSEILRWWLLEVCHSCCLNRGLFGICIDLLEIANNGGLTL
jgi:hypothetical protein